MESSVKGEINTRTALLTYCFQQSSWFFRNSYMVVRSARRHRGVSIWQVYKTHQHACHEFNGAVLISQQS